MEAKFPLISKNMPITIHASLLVTLVILVWVISQKFSNWEAELDLLKRKANYRWSSQMEEDAWEEWVRTGEKPDIQKIRSRYSFYLNDE